MNRGHRFKVFKEEFSMKESIYATANAWNMVTKGIVSHAWYTLWTAARISDNDEQNSDFEVFYTSSEEKTVSDF